MEAYESGLKKIGDHKMKASKLLLEEAMSDCGWLTEELNSVNQKFKMMEQRENWTDL